MTKKEENMPAVQGGQMLPGAVQELPDDIKSEMGSIHYSLRLMAPLSNPVIAQNIQAGNWAVINGEKVIANLGTHPTIIPVAYTLKALDVSNEDNVRVSHDANSDLYKAIKADVPTNSKKIFSGVEYLMYIDGYGFAPYYCASVSAKRSAQDILGSSINKVLTLGVDLVKSKGNTFHVPAISEDCDVITLPSEDALAKGIAAWRTGLASSEKRANDSKVDGAGDR